MREFSPYRYRSSRRYLVRFNAYFVQYRNNYRNRFRIARHSAAGKEPGR